MFHITIYIQISKSTKFIYIIIISLDNMSMYLCALPIYDKNERFLSAAIYLRDGSIIQSVDFLRQSLCIKIMESGR